MSSKRTTLPGRVQALRKRAGRLPRLHWMVAGILAAGLLGWLLYRTPGAPAPRTGAEVAQAHPAGPPWRHGPADARLTLTLYADLECPFCKAYYPTLMAWIDAHPETSLRWHHLPLAMHDPEASRLARVAECAGEAQGHEAFFDAIAWLYQNTRGDGQGLPTDHGWPGLTTAIQACLDSAPPHSHRSRAGRRGPAQRHQRHAHRAAGRQPNGEIAAAARSGRGRCAAVGSGLGRVRRNCWTQGIRITEKRCHSDRESSEIA